MKNLLILSIFFLVGMFAGAACVVQPSNEMDEMSNLDIVERIAHIPPHLRTKTEQEIVDTWMAQMFNE